MAITIGVYFYEGIAQAPVASGTRFTTDSVGTLKQPYMDRSVISVDAIDAVSTAPAPAKCSIMHVQIPDNSAVRFEINPPNRSVTATTDSPRITADQTFVIGPGWSASFLEAV